LSKKTYFPDRGDLIHLNFSPSAGREHSGAHYGLVLSTSSFAKVTGYALVCPITSRIRGWPFEVVIPKGILPRKNEQAIESALLTDQVKSLDYRERGVQYLCKCPDNILDAVLEIVRAIIDADDVTDEI
jgi:mRNA interferase MazF